VESSDDYAMDAFVKQIKKVSTLEIEVSRC
jgi:hypothetical protein